MESISINDLIWIQLKERLISFNYKELPNGVHFTISFNQESEFINFHLTKNIKDIKRKPKIEICRIKKEDLEEIIPQIISAFQKLFLEKIDKYDNNYLNFYFLSFDELEKEGIQKGFEKKIMEKFRDISKVKRKKRLKIKGEIGSRLDNIVQDEEIQDFLVDKIKKYDPKLLTLSSGGLLFSKKNDMLCLIKIQENYYKINFETKPVDFLKLVIGENNLKYLINYTKKSIEIIKNANCYEDCEEWNNPMHFVLNSD